MPISDYLSLAWFLSNLITGLAYLWVAYEIHTWTLGLPRRGTGFRTLARLFEGFITVCGVHHLIMCTLIWEQPTPLYIVLTDMVVCVSAFMTATTLHFARGIVQSAFASMLRHESEWHDQQP